MSELGNSVTKSAKFIAKIGEQVESMIQLITTNLSDSFKNKFLGYSDNTLKREFKKSYKN